MEKKYKKKSNKEVIFLTLILFFILFLIGLVIYLVINNINNNNINSQNDKEVDSIIYNEILIGDLEFKINDIKYDGMFSDVTVEVKNKTNNTIKLGYVKLIFKDKESNILGELLSTNVEAVNSSESVILKTSIDVDLSSATTVEYELIGGNNNEE